MSDFVDKVSTLLKERNITKNKMLTDLHLSKNSFVDWRKRGTIPNAVVVSAIAEYLGTSIQYLMGDSADNTIISVSSLTDEESRLLELYRELNIDNKTLLLADAIKLQRQQSFDQTVSGNSPEQAK